MNNMIYSNKSKRILEGLKDSCEIIPKHFGFDERDRDIFEEQLLLIIDAILNEN